MTNTEPHYPVRFRPAGGGLHEAMERMQVFRCREDFDSYIAAYVEETNSIWPGELDAATVSVHPYCGADDRIGWAQTWIVSFPSPWGPIGYTDGPI